MGEWTVAFDVPYGPRELVVNGENGYLVPYPNIDAMANKVVKIMKDKNLQMRLSEHAVVSSKRYSEKSVSDRWKTLFHSLGIAKNEC